MQEINEFVGYKLHRDTREIEFRGSKSRLRPKEMEVLILLLKYKGRTISRKFILDHVWGDKFGNDLGLTQVISHLRKTFRQSAQKEVSILTIPGRGYQLTISPENVKTLFWSKPVKKTVKISLVAFVIISSILMIRDQRPLEIQITTEERTLQFCLQKPEVGKSGICIAKYAGEVESPNYDPAAL